MQDPIVVTTFDPTIEAGTPARSLYRSAGFRDSTVAGRNPAGIPTVTMTLLPQNGLEGGGQEWRLKNEGRNPAEYLFTGSFKPWPGAIALRARTMSCPCRPSALDLPMLKDGDPGFPPAGRSGPGGGAGRRRIALGRRQWSSFAQGQKDFEDSAEARPTLDRNGPIERAHKPQHDREPQAAAGELGAEEKDRRSCPGLLHPCRSRYRRLKCGHIPGPRGPNPAEEVLIPALHDLPGCRRQCEFPLPFRRQPPPRW